MAAASTTTELMHAVLDGEASAEQAQALQRALAADPAVQAEFAALQDLFTQLGQVPQQIPPEGLVAAVMAAVDQPATRSSRRFQLFPWLRVFGAAPRDAVARASTSNHRATRSQPFLRSTEMSNQTSSPFGNRKLWIGGAVAAVAVVVVAQFGFNSKTSDKDVIGTVAPADRYRAPQATAGDIKVGTPTSGQTAQGNPAVQADSANNAAAQGAAAQGAAAQGAAAQGAAAQGAAAQGAAAQGAAAQGAAAQGAAAQGAAAQGAAAQGAAAQGAAAQGAAAQGAAAQSKAAQGAAAQGAAAQGAAAQSKAAQGAAAQSTAGK